MLEQTYPSKRPNPPPTIAHPVCTSSALEKSAKRFNISTTEFQRRDVIVRGLSRACKYRAGDSVVLTDKTIPYTKTGDITVRHIVESYAGMGHEEPWPPTNNPFLVTVSYSANPESVIRCTTNYVELAAMPMEICE